MDTRTNDSIEDLIRRLRCIEGKSEGIYLSLGATFPRLSAEADRSSAEARHAIGKVAAVRARRGQRLELEEFLASSSKVIDVLAVRDSRFLGSVDEGVRRLSGLDGIIKRVRADSEEMELISLNAMTVALKSGNAGRAFSIITDELKRLSGRTIQVTVDIEYKGANLLDSFRQLKAMLERMTAARDLFFGGVRSTLGGGFERLGSDIDSVMTEFGELTEKAEAVKAPITGIMQSMQWQDIIRQSLDHVVISLGESAQEAGTSLVDDLAFTAATLKLSGELVEDIEKKVHESACSLENDVERLVGVVESLERERAEFVGQFSAGGGERATERDDSAAYLSGKGKTVSYALALSERVETLNDEFKALATILVRFKNIVVASRIETARSRGLLRKSNTVYAMERLTERIEMDIGEATTLTRSFIKSAKAEIDGYACDREAADRALGMVLPRIEETFLHLKDSQEQACAAVASFRLYTDDFITVVAEARKGVAELRFIDSELHAMRSELAAIERAHVVEIEAVGGVDLSDYSIKSERLKSMIDRFTIFTHKEAAGKVGHFDVETGVDTGVTLF